MPTIKQFEEFTAQWQFDHRGKYPTAFDYFIAIWNASQEENNAFWIGVLHELVSAETMLKLADALKRKTP